MPPARCSVLLPPLVYASAWCGVDSAALLAAVGRRVVVDAEGRPVSVTPPGKAGEDHEAAAAAERNVIVWMDHRAAHEAELINATSSSFLYVACGCATCVVSCAVRVVSFFARSLMGRGTQSTRCSSTWAAVYRPRWRAPRSCGSSATCPIGGRAWPTSSTWPTTSPSR